YDLDRPEQLVKLLVRMARNKVVSAARHHQRQRRDTRRTDGGDSARLSTAVDKSPSPSDMISGQELLRELRRRLSADERQLVELRAEGLAWADIADRVGGTAQARRMQHSRAIE